MSAYYNEIDPYCVQWLRNLIRAGAIASGDVDDRPIQEVQPADVAGYTQCHFFAGLGGWSHAARLAGWPDDRPLWTGSCPCQPFSVAGGRKGIEDARHLWPDFHRLIRPSRPAVVMGEQTSSTPGYAWLHGVESDLEAEAYTFRAVDIPACSVNAPEIRNRLYWVACTEDQESGRRRVCRPGESRGPDKVRSSGEFTGRGEGMRLACSDDAGLAVGSLAGDQRGDVRSEGAAALSGGAGNGGFGQPHGDGCGWTGLRVSARRPQQADADAVRPSEGFWDDWQLIGPDPDGNYRRIKPGLAPLVARVSGHVGQIRAYGNAINAELAAEVIRAFMDVTHG